MDSTFNAYLLSLDQVSFTALIKHYLGSQKSYHNHKSLSQQLSHYLLQPEVWQKMEAVLDQSDRKILAVLAYFKTFTEQQLQIFIGSISGYKAHLLLKNLQERLLIIYNSEQNCYSLNPLLINFFNRLNLTLAPFFTYHSLNLKLVPFWFNSNQLTAFLACHQHGQKKSLTGLPDSKLELLNQAFTQLNLITKQGLNKPALETFTLLNFNQQVAFLAAGYVSPCPKEQQILAKVLTTLLNNYNEKWFSSVLIERWWLFYAETLPPMNVLTQLKAFLLFDSQQQLISFASLTQPTAQKWVIDSNALCYLMPHQNLCLALAAAFQLDKYDTVSQYSLTQESFLKAVALGYSPASLIEALKQEGSSTFPSTLETLFLHWYEEYQRVQLFKGYVLKLSNESDKLLKTSGLLETLVEQTLAPGCYLLKEEPSQAFFNQLSQLGFRPPSLKQADANAVPIPFNLPLLPCNFDIKADTLQDEKSLYPIERKIALFQHQDQPKPFLQEIEYCNGFDFQRKLRLIKMAIEHHYNLLLEINANSTENIYIKPLSLKMVNQQHQLKAINLKTDKIIKGFVENLIGITLIKPHLVH